MTAPTTDPLAADWSDVADVLCSEPLGRALWERAQLTVLARRQAEQAEQQAERIRELEQAVRGPAGSSGDG